MRLFLQQRGDMLWTSVFGQRGAEVSNEFNTAMSQLANRHSIEFVA